MHIYVDFNGAIITVNNSQLMVLWWWILIPIACYAANIILLNVLSKWCDDGKEFETTDHDRLAYGVVILLTPITLPFVVGFSILTPTLAGLHWCALTIGRLCKK